MMKSKWLKVLALTLVAAFSIAMLAGCSGGTTQPTTAPTQAPANNGGDGEGSNEPAQAKDPSEYTGSVMFWCGDKNWAELMVPAFNKVYPNIEVTWTPLNWSEYQQKLQTSIAGGLQIPDMICAEVAWRKMVYAMDIVENLEAAPYNLDRNDMFEYLWPRCENDKGEIVGIEQQLTPAGLAYRKDIAKEVWGVEKPEEVEKLFADKGGAYDGYIAMGKELYEKTNGEKTLFPSLFEAWELLSRQTTIARVNEDGSINATEQLTPIIETLRQFGIENVCGKLESGTPAFDGSWAQGNVMCYVMPTWRTQPLYNDYDPDAAPGTWGIMIPAGGVISWGGTTSSIYKESQNKEATWEFIRWTCWDLEGAKVAVEREYQLSRKSNYEADPSLGSKHNDYLDTDIFQFWAERAVDEAIAAVPTIYDSVVNDAAGVAITAFSADNSLTTEQMMETIKTEIKNKLPDVEVK